MPAVRKPKETPKQTRRGTLSTTQAEAITQSRAVSGASITLRVGGSVVIMSEKEVIREVRKAVTRDVIAEVIHSMVKVEGDFAVLGAAEPEPLETGGPLRAEDLFGPGDAEFFNGFAKKSPKG